MSESTYHVVEVTRYEVIEITDNYHYLLDSFESETEADKYKDECEKDDDE